MEAIYGDPSVRSDSGFSRYFVNRSQLSGDDGGCGIDYDEDGSNDT